MRQYGFQDLLYVVGRESYTPRSLAEFCNTNNIRAVSLSRSRTNKVLIDTLTEYDIKAYIYTLNNIDEMRKFIDQDVNGFFTDFIIPEKIGRK
ncbi:glycerophosphodiester phosphodiesterase family protein [Lentibacillus salinarum]|uniref:Glycerophosphodiester phosphodiesterase family protein n=1 Tax=Lentibacillus salinarum TaxID=446820 RepID=A0ABW3ZZ24_9BACI